MIPLPQTLRDVIRPQVAAAAGAINRSLVFDKTAEPPRSGQARDTEWKQKFLSGFVGDYRQHGALFGHEYDQFIDRRTRALAQLDARKVEIESSSRLIVGQGLPHATEVGFSFDRLRGVPYLPGSTLKGLLRRTAALVDAGELSSGDASVDQRLQMMARNAASLFGDQSRRGSLICEDAFPAGWPELQVDVMTPHHGDYYGDESGEMVPGDWESPVPVCFLTIAARQQFRFWFLADSSIDLPAVEPLVRLALDWLGIGGKTSSGYGRFSGEIPFEDPIYPVKSGAAPVKSATTEVWPKATLTYTPNDGTVTATWDGNKATGKHARADLPEAFLKKKSAVATVTVELLGNMHIIKKIDWS